MHRRGFSAEGFNDGSSNPSEPYRRGVLKGGEKLRPLRQTLKFGVSKAVFSEDLKILKHKILDPQDTFLIFLNRLIYLSCILAVAIDPLFFYILAVDSDSVCLTIDRKLAVATTAARTIVDAFYLIRIYLQFHTAYIAPSSRVFGRGELMIDPMMIAKRYLRRYFFIDFLSVLPCPQILIWRFLHTPSEFDIRYTKYTLLLIIMVQYIPRFVRFFPLSSELKRTTGVFAETAWAGAAYNLIWFLLASHIAGAIWYLLAIVRQNDCWKDTCSKMPDCETHFLYCGHLSSHGFSNRKNVTEALTANCFPDSSGNSAFAYGIYLNGLTSGVFAPGDFVPKFFFCLWFGLQNLSTLGQGLVTTANLGEVIYSTTIGILGLILLALLIGNMETYLQSVTIRLEEMRVKRRDSEQWMHHRLLPHDIRERVRKYDQYKWMETHGVDEEEMIQSLPKDLRRDIKRHLCLALVKRVALFDNMDESILDAICERLKPTLYIETAHIVREGDPVDEMLFIIRGRLESVTTDGGRADFFNRGVLNEGDFCGEELLTWALDPKAGVNLPSSTRTVKALTEVEAFALTAEEIKFVASQFRRLHSRQVQHTFRFHSQQWRTWAACFIQAAWRRYKRRTMLREMRRQEGKLQKAGSGSLGATVFASRFASRARRIRDLSMPRKPPEPDFGDED